MTAIPYRPKLNRLIDTSVLPDSLSFVSDTADDVLSYFSVSDLNISLSESRDFKYYSLKLHTDKKIGFTIPIFNITILLNPPDETGTVNEAFFDITFFRKWELLKYINELDTADILNFSFSEYFDLIKNMFNLSDEKLIHSVIKNFVVPPCDGQILNTQSLDIKQYFNDFITEINTLISSSNPPIDISSITNPDFLDLVNAIKNSSLSIIEVVEHFINIDPNNSKINLLSIIKPWFSNFTWERILEIVLPQYYLSINEITLGIEFTRNILKPIDPVTGEPDTNENNKTIVRFTVGDLVFSSKRGFDFSEEYSLTIPESEILNTGLILDVSAAKLDLSSKKNIPEATADGRPVTFTGVFIESVKILLPPEWGTPKDSQGAPLPSGVEILCSNLLIGNEGGVSGLIGVSGYVFEYYIDFEISGTNKITYDSTSDKITIEGLDNKQKVIQAQSSGDT
ncbi:MAG: hypothetical protein H8E98_00500, partial [Bacteroidetes bacterium]|nr:hypothetical protein [Bacteroidota bacterium]